MQDTAVSTTALMRVHLRDGWAASSTGHFLALGSVPAHW
jgi:hypothetical protein